MNDPTARTGPAGTGLLPESAPNDTLRPSGTLPGGFEPLMTVSISIVHAMGHVLLCGYRDLWTGGRVYARRNRHMIAVSSGPFASAHENVASPCDQEWPMPSTT